MLNRLLICVCFFFCFLSGYAQVKIHANGKELNYSGAGIQYAFMEGSDFSDTALLKISPAAWESLSSKKMALGFNTKSIWLKIPVASVASAGKFDILEIKNPHINFLRVWIKRKDGIVKSFPLTGDHLPFRQKTLPERNFSFPVSSADYRGDTVLIAAEKRNVTFHLEMEFADQIIHAQSLQLSIVWWGIFAGFVLMLLLINFYLLFSLKEMLYLWYSLYLFFILCYLGADTGLFFEFIYPDLPQMNDLIRPFFLSMSLLPMMLFYNSMLELKTLSPRLYRVNYFTIKSYFIILVTAYTTCLSGNVNVYTFWLKVQSVYVPLILFLLLVESVYCVWQKIQFSVFALISFTAIALCIAILSLVQNSLLPLNGFTAYAHYFAFITDAVVVASSLVYRYYIMAEKAREIREKYTEQQEKIFQETSAWYQEEMGRMSSLLHDSVGADIGILRIKAESMELTEKGRNKLSGYIQKIGDEVRYMSHHFSPLLLREKGLYHALDEYISMIREELGISIQFDWTGERSNPEFKYQIIIYRIVQELLQNIKKHSNATEVMVQIMNEPAYISIYVEDNGKVGADDANIKLGLGLKSIRHLTELLNGRFHMKAEAGKGFMVSVEFEKAVVG